MNKQTGLLLAFLLAHGLALEAQNVVTTESNLMRNADSANMQRMEYSWSGDKGKEQFWDFSSVELLSGDYPIEFYSDSLGNFQKLEDRGIYYYLLENNLLKQNSYENRLEKINYDKEKLAMRFPLQYGDSLVSSFSGKGRYCGDHKIKVEGQVLLQADGYGTLVLSERDTLKNALRVYTLTTTSMAIDMDSAIIDPTNLKQEIEEKYEWYVRGYRYPLYETIQRTSYSNLEPVASKSYAYRLLPDDLNISNDQANDSIKNADATRKAEELEQQKAQQDIIHYNVEVNGSNVTLNYTLDADGTVNTLISDVLGMVYKRGSRTTKAGENVSLSFDCSNLKRGNYVLYMNVNGKVYSEKVNLK